VGLSPKGEGANVTLVNLPVIHRTGDPYGDIPFMPTGVLYLAGFLRANGISATLVDGFGLAPRRRYRIDHALSAMGLTEEEIVDRLGPADVVGVSVHSGMGHEFALRLGAKIKAKLPHAVLVAGGHHPSIEYGLFLRGGYDYVCIGEGERTFLELVQAVQNGQCDVDSIPGLAHGDVPPIPRALEPDLDQFGFAALDLLPLEDYWALGMSHAPIQGRYMVISSSRGCPHGCRFCTTPEVFGRQWRTRSARHIVDEIEAGIRDHAIEEVVVEDEMFGATRESALRFAREIVRRQLHIRLYLPSGVRVERWDAEVMTALREAGLQYMCIAPESGSARILKQMSKTVDLEHMCEIVRIAQRLHIRLGAFFLIGFENENDEERRMTEQLLVRLTKSGVDEIGVFIWSPLPGADAFGSETGWTRFEDLNWSPAWRHDFKKLNRFRLRLYWRWAGTKALHHPLRLCRSAVNVLRGRSELKSEMALRRILRSRFGANNG